jgi:alanine-glyoxylate transaminase/serine-glyoxylate transaminase/serine-pyruvate transaminase
MKGNPTCLNGTWQPTFNWSCRLPMLNAVCIPEGVDDAEIRTRLLSEYKIEIGGGLGPLAGKIWRIGLMGHTARPENVDKLIQALAAVLPDRTGN